MAIDKQLGTESNPDVRTQGSAVEVFPDTTREDQIAEAAQIIINKKTLQHTITMKLFAIALLVLAVTASRHTA